MGRYALRRLLLLIPTLLGMSLFIFLMLRLLPGDVVDLMTAGQEQATDDAKRNLREAFGLADPLPIQYVKWILGLLRGDPGKSLRSGQPIADALGQALPVTFELTILAVLMATIIAIPLGVLSASRRDSSADFAGRIAGLVGLSIPSFWLATLTLLFTSLVFSWVPPVSWVSPTIDPLGNLEQMLLPGRGAGRAIDGDRNAYDPHHDARGAESGLRPHRARKGRERASGDLSTCAPQRLDSGRLGDRLSDRHADGRLSHHRSHFRIERHRRYADSSHLQSRLSDGPGLGPVPGGSVRGGQHERRSAVRLPGPADQVRVSDAIQIAVPTPLPVAAATGQVGLRRAWRRWRNPIGMVGAVVILITVVLAVAAPLVAPFEPSSQAHKRLLPPGAPYLMGTDELGRDTFSRIVFGARVSLQVGALAVTIALVLGTSLGLLGGFYGGRLDDVLMRVVDIMFAFPGIVLAIVIAGLLGPSRNNAMLAIGIVYAPAFCARGAGFGDVGEGRAVYGVCPGDGRLRLARDPAPRPAECAGAADRDGQRVSLPGDSQ